MTLHNYVESLLWFAVFLCALMSFGSRLRWWCVPALCALALLWVLIDVPFVIARDFFPHANPQQVIGYASALTTSMLVLATIRKRSLDRLMILMANTAVIATTLIFHFVLIERIMPEWNKTGAFSYSYLQNIPKDEFTASCERSGLDCYIGSDIEGSALGERLKESLGPIHEHSVAQHPDRPIVFGYALNDETTTSVATTVLYIYNHGEARVIASPIMGTYIHDNIKLNFFIMVCCASNFWLFGSIFLLAFHKRRFAGRK